MGPVRASPASGVLGSRPACAPKGLLFLYKMAVMIIAPQKTVFQLLRVLSRDMAVGLVGKSTLLPMGTHFVSTHHSLTYLSVIHLFIHSFIKHPFSTYLVP